jgi:hypothetical protein
MFTRKSTKIQRFATNFMVIFHQSTIKHCPIKNKIMAERIPLSTEALSEDEWDFVELDMEFEEEANPKDFYTLFQYNPETKDYYDLPFN